MPVGKNLNLNRETVIPRKTSPKNEEPEKEKKDLKPVAEKEKKKKDKKGKDKPKSNKLSVREKEAGKKEKKKEKLTSGKKEKKKAKQEKVKNKELQEKVDNRDALVEVPEIVPEKGPVVEEQGQEMGLLEMIEERESTRYNVIIEPSRRKAVKKTKITLEGELTIGHSSGIHAKIAPVLKEYEQFSFSLREVQELDLSIIQMLYSYKTGLEKAGKTASISADLSRELKQLVQTSGFSPLLYPTRN